MTGIYIHIPFCKKKCNYCDFISTEDLSVKSQYLNALKTEIKLSGPLYKDIVNSVYIGGGTPNILDTNETYKLLKTLNEYFKITDDAEITIEANPGLLDHNKCKQYLECGINRMSLGLQATQKNLLKLLGRIHTVYEFDVAYNTARDAGFNNINIDLIYGIPTQNNEDWLESLFHTLYLSPDHISCYSLKIEENTALFKAVTNRSLTQKDEDADADQYLAAVDLLTQKGFINYEISNFSRFEKECRHNLKYWNLENYLGLGVAAHSNIDEIRFSNTSDIGKYIKQMQTGALHYNHTQFISKSEREFEYIMLKTRLKRGVEFKSYNEIFNMDFRKKYSEQIEKARYMGLCEVTDKALIPTLKGFLFQNKLVNILTEEI